MTREGYIFVIVEGMEGDVYVKASKTRNALDGDIVRVAVTKGVLRKVGEPQSEETPPQARKARGTRSCEG